MRVWVRVMGYGLGIGNWGASLHLGVSVPLGVRC
jgi:hypothetical protein